MSTTNRSWQAADHGAKHAHAPIEVRLTESGVWQCRIGSSPATVNLVAATPLVVEDTYARGDDFVVTNAATDGFPFRTQLYWSCRGAAAPGDARLMLTVSLQTDRLDTHPVLDLVFETDDAARSADGNALLGDEGRVAVAPLPVDRPECDLILDSARSIVRFAPPFLEKGVIRRARFALLASVKPFEESTVSDQLAELSGEPLPLTT